jgi:hypothetical protein
VRPQNRQQPERPGRRGRLLAAGESLGAGACRVTYGWPLKPTVVVCRRVDPKSQAAIRTVPTGAPGGGSTAPSRVRSDHVFDSLLSARSPP